MISNPRPGQSVQILCGKIRAIHAATWQAWAGDISGRRPEAEEPRHRDRRQVVCDTDV